MQRVNEDLREYAACGSKKGGAAEPVRTQGEKVFNFGLCIPICFIEARC